MYVQIKDYKQRAAKKYPLFVNDGATDQNKFLSDIWSYAKATFDEDVQIYDRLHLGDECISSGTCYVQTINKKTAKGIIDMFGVGSIVRKPTLLEHGEEYQLFDVTDFMISGFYKTLSSLLNIPWIGLPLIDEAWCKQALFNTHLDANKVLGYSDDARIYELTENGIDRKNILIVRIVTDLFLFDFTVYFSPDLKVIDDDFDIMKNDLVDGRSSTTFLQELSDDIITDTLTTIVDEWYPEKADTVIVIPEEIESREFSNFIFDLMSPQLTLLLKKKFENRDIKSLSCVVPNEGKLKTTAVKYKPKTETSEILTEYPPLIREPRFDQPLLFISGHIRTYRSGKQVMVKGYKRHKRMKADWYEHED